MVHMVLEYVGLVGLDGSPSYDMKLQQRRLPNLTVAWEEGREGKTAIADKGSCTDGANCWK